MIRFAAALSMCLPGGSVLLRTVLAGTVLVGVLLSGVLLSGAVQAVEFSGQYTNLLFQTRDSLVQNRTTDLNRLRLKLDDQWYGGALRAHLAYDHELLWGGMVADPVISAGLQRPDATWLDASATLSQRSQLNWQHKLYRGWLTYDAGAVSIKVGRQRIAWGSGRIWNPSDRFNPVQPTALELDQKLGVDAALAQWNYSNSASVVAVVGAGRPAYGVSRKAALRWQDTWGEFDVALMLGRIGNENMFAFDVTGNLADAGVRLEWMQAKNASEGVYGQLSTGLDYTWSNSWFPNGLYGAIEYFYNGAAGFRFGAVGLNPNRLNPNRLNSLSRHLLGGQLAYDLTALWRFEALLISDLQRPGWFVAPALTWSIFENIDIQAFAQLPQGGADSEFGRFETLYALRLDWYF